MDKRLPSMCRWADTCQRSLSTNTRAVLIVLIVTLGNLIPISDTCSCTLQHPQDYFCSADFVVKARVKSVTPIFSKPVPGEEPVKLQAQHMRYSMRVIKTFKANEAFKRVNQTYLYTPAHDGNCGMRFQINQKYLISGYVSGGKLHTLLCYYNGIWLSLTKWQRRGFTTLYKDICDCKVQVCFNDNCYQKNMIENRENMCILDVHRDRDLCYMKHSRCSRSSRRQHGECEWNRTGDFKRCRTDSKRDAWAEP